MKNIRFCIILTVVLGVLMGISCGSAPAPDTAADSGSAGAGGSAPDTAAPGDRPAAGGPGPGQVALDTMNAAAARANEARKQASDVDSPGYFPGDWEAAEAQYAAAQRMPGTTDDEALAAAAAYDAVAGMYDAMFKRTAPLYAQGREDEIMAARDALVASGFAAAFPELLSPADHTAVQALEQYEEGDYHAARDSAAAALSMYETLLTGSDCWIAWQEITDRGFSLYDHETFDEADERAETAARQYTAGDIASAGDSAAAALQKYTQVLHTGWAAYSSRRAASAEAERQAAVAMKADIAVREMFHEADVVYQQAAGVLDAGDYEEAAALYTNAEALFIMSSMATSEKRRIAAETIREADEVIGLVTEAARQNEGGSR